MTEERDGERGGARVSRLRCLASRQTHLCPTLIASGSIRRIKMQESRRGVRRETHRTATGTVALPSQNLIQTNPIRAFRASPLAKTMQIVDNKLLADEIRSSRVTASHGQSQSVAVMFW
jgi:hypothetical protein